MFQFLLSLENRVGVILKRKNNTCSRTKIPGVTNAGQCEIRQHHLTLPAHRLFTRGQKTVLENLHKTPFSTDGHSFFSTTSRVALCKQTETITGGSSEKNCQEKETASVRFLKNSVIESTWVDGESNAIRLRPCAVSEISAFVQDCFIQTPCDNRVDDALIVVSDLLNVPAHPNGGNFISADPNLSKTPAEIVFSKSTLEIPQTF